MALPVKVILLFLGAVAYRTAAKSPTPPPSQNDHVIKETYFDKGPGPRVMLAISALFCIGYLMTEGAVILIIYFQNNHSSGHMLSVLCPAPSPSLYNLSTISPLFLLGISTMFAGAVLRVWCFRVLGEFFTYEITIKPNHKLITWGPYAYVRHPSYTAIMLMVAGTAAICVSPGSYLNECQIVSSAPVRWIVLLWAVFLLFSGLSVWRRGKVEDKSLRDIFKASWDRYSHAVPYSFIPGII